MKFTIRYIPLNQIKPAAPGAVTERIKQLRRLMGDCMHVIAVRPNESEGTYSLLTGQDRLDYMLNHTKKKYAPCIVDKRHMLKERGRLIAMLSKLFAPLARSGLLHELAPARRSIIHTFLKTEPRFRELPRLQQWKVLLLAVRYRQTVLAIMRLAVDRYSNERMSE